jgi:hypothetical protein
VLPLAPYSSYDSGTSAIAVDPRPAHPGWPRTGWALLVGYFYAALLLAVPGVVLVLLGLIDRVESRRPPGVVVAPFAPGGVWAVAADLAVGAVVVTVTAVVVQETLVRQTGHRMRREVLGGTIVVTGWAPYLGFHLLAVGCATAFVATLLVARFSSTPALAAEVDPIPVRLLVGTVAVAAVLVLSYSAFHPLREVSLGAFSGSIGSGASIDIRNSGVADLTIVSISGPATTGVFPRISRPLAGTVIPARKKLTIYLRRRACEASEIHVRYRMLGREWTQPLLPPKSCN